MPGNSQVWLPTSRAMWLPKKAPQESLGGIVKGLGFRVLGFKVGFRV